MSRYVFFLALLCGTTLSACVPLNVSQMATRTPTDFLLSIKAVADMNQFENTNFVGNKLRINLVNGPEQPVFDFDGSSLIGYQTDIGQTGMAPEYSATKFEYGLFQPPDRAFNRALVTLSVNAKSLCVTTDDLISVFKKVRRSVNPHMSAPSYVYDGETEKDWTYFKFESSGCLSEFSFFKNNQRK